MSSPESVHTPPAPAGPLPGSHPAAAAWADRVPARRAVRTGLARVNVGHAALLPVLALSAVLEVNHLSRNGWANNYYSAAVRSMLHSGHNFVFASFDPGGLLSIDKPPIGVWIQTASAKLFGFHPMSLLLPEAVAAVLACAALYWIVSRRLGVWAGVASALALAVFPSFVAITRDNDPDAFLILFMVLACGAGLRAVETGRLRSLLWCAVLVGLAFNAKALAAYLVLPSIVVAYLVLGPHSVWKRAGQVAVAGVALVAVSAAWMGLVDLTPAHQRPYVGGTTDNSEFTLTFNYNGLGRVGGQVGGPGRVPNVITGTNVSGRAGPHRAPRVRVNRGLGAGPLTPAAVAAAGANSGSAPRSIPVHGRLAHPIAFSGGTGPLRLFDTALGDQGGWMLPFALAGLVAMILVLPARRDARWGPVAVLGGWFVVEAVVLSASRGIVHPYYVSALAPGAAAMVGGGAAALVGLLRRGRGWWALAAAGVAGTVAVQLVLLHREHYLGWFEPALIVGAALALGAILALPGRWRVRWPGPLTAALLAVLLVAPTAYASTVWSAPVEGTFPAAGPHFAPGPGGVGVKADSLPNYVNLIAYLRSHRATPRWTVLTDATSPASPLILLGISAGSMGGYSGTDPVLDGPGLARLIRRGEARYVLLGGAYASRGGNQATTAVAIACRQVPQAAWRGLAPPAPSVPLNGGPLAPPKGLTRSGAAQALATPPPAGPGLRARFAGHVLVAGPASGAPPGRAGAGPGAAASLLGPAGAAGAVPGGGGPGPQLGLGRRGRPRRRTAPLQLMPFSYALYDCAGRAALLEARG